MSEMPAYTGVSIVDYLKSINQPTDFASRSTLAASKGIQGYTGTAEQNTQLLNTLRGTATAQPTQQVQQTTQQPAQQTQTAQPTATAPTGQPTSAQDLVNMGYYGYTAWGDAEALADFKATGGAGKGGPTGAGAGAGGLDLMGLYDSLYASAGISDKEKSLVDMEKQFLEARGKITDNPFLSSSLIDQRIARLKQKYEEETLPIRSEIAMKKADIEMKLNLQMKQFDIDSQQARDALNQFNSLLESGALDSATGEDIARITMQTGVSSTMIQSAINARKDTSAETQVITSTADNGEVTATVINKQTGEIINQNSLGKVGNVQSGNTKPTATEEKAELYEGIRERVEGGMTWDALYSAIRSIPGITESDMRQIYGIYANYGSYSPDLDQQRQDLDRYGL